MKKESHIPAFLTLLVFAVFAVCLLMVLLSGAKVYSNLHGQGVEQYARRVTVQYLTTRVRQAQTVRVEDFCGYSALTMEETIDGDVYLTRVYCYDSAIRELYSAQTAPVAPEDGASIAEAETLTFSLDDGLLTVMIDGTPLALRIPTGREVRP